MGPLAYLECKEIKMKRMKEFKKVCIANRGEIACRIIRACKSQGIKTVVLYSDPDANSLAVKLADEAISLGGTTALESYLDLAKVIDAAKKSGADALHPGYGLLSEKAQLATACESAGIIFIGPSALSMEKMGMKNVAREIVSKLNLPIVPGYNGEKQSLDIFKSEAKKMGFPVLLKAAAGGGGKGMQIIEREDQFENAWASAQRNAKSAFGDQTLLMEKYFPHIKHIEIQILGDQQGKIVHLFERECSVQRRHQKIIEETPAPSLSAKLKNEMGQTAIAIAGAVNYIGAGTIEFILDTATQHYYFLEMNTRIQVEHAITEEVVGIDLVAWQLKIAQGMPIDFNQESVTQKGHALECRLCVEDWQNNFLPASGKILRWRWQELKGLRIDHGIEENGMVGIYYDSMLAKIVTYGHDRNESIKKMQYALANLELLGPSNNRPLLISILNNDTFKSGNYDTGFISQNIDKIKVRWQEEMAQEQVKEEIVVAAWLSTLWQSQNKKNTVWTKMGLIPAWRNNFYCHQKKDFQLGTETLTLLYEAISTSEFYFQIATDWKEEKKKKVQMIKANDGVVIFLLEGKRVKYSLAQEEDKIFIHHENLGAILLTELPRFKSSEKAKSKSNHVAPMPGKIIKVLVRAGDQVKTDDELVIIESMKMENSVRAIRTGLVTEVFVAHGQLVEKNDRLIKFEKEE